MEEKKGTARAREESERWAADCRLSWAESRKERKKSFSFSFHNISKYFK
jgi:hypothetical protein